MASRQEFEAPQPTWRPVPSDQTQWHTAREREKNRRRAAASEAADAANVAELCGFSDGATVAQQSRPKDDKWVANFGDGDNDGTHGSPGTTGNSSSTSSSSDASASTSASDDISGEVAAVAAGIADGLSITSPAKGGDEGEEEEEEEEAGAAAAVEEATEDGENVEGSEDKTDDAENESSPTEAPRLASPWVGGDVWEGSFAVDGRSIGAKMVRRWGCPFRPCLRHSSPAEDVAQGLSDLTLTIDPVKMSELTRTEYGNAAVEAPTQYL